MEMEGKVIRGPQKGDAWGERRNRGSAVGVGDGWEGEVIRRSKLVAGHEVGTMRSSELGRRDWGKEREPGIRFEDVKGS